MGRNRLWWVVGGPAALVVVGALLGRPMPAPVAAQGTALVPIREFAYLPATVTINLIEPGTMYGERMNQFDVRIAKIFTVNGVRLQGSMDLYNAFNANAIPVAVVNPRQV